MNVAQRRARAAHSTGSRRLNGDGGFGTEGVLMEMRSSYRFIPFLASAPVASGEFPVPALKLPVLRNIFPVNLHRELPMKWLPYSSFLR
jgi:hypothetical protein